MEQWILLMAARRVECGTTTKGLRSVFRSGRLTMRLWGLVLRRFAIGVNVRPTYAGSQDMIPYMVTANWIGCATPSTMQLLSLVRNHFNFKLFAMPIDSGALFVNGLWLISNTKQSIQVAQSRGHSDVAKTVTLNDLRFAVLTNPLSSISPMTCNWSVLKAGVDNRLNFNHIILAWLINYRGYTMCGIARRSRTTGTDLFAYIILWNQFVWRFFSLAGFWRFFFRTSR